MQFERVVFKPPIEVKTLFISDVLSSGDCGISIDEMGKVKQVN